MKILSAKQMHELDRAIMDREGITSLQLMERAAEGLAARIMQRFPDASRNFKILCGCGNNGGDGLAIGRILHSHGYDVECFLLESDRYSDDCRTNAKLVESLGILHTIGEYNKMPDFNDSDIIIDALFGSGLNREISGVAAYMACRCIFEKNFVIAIDIPSGLADNTIPDDTIEDEFGDVAEVVVRADWTLTIEAPFLSMLVPENQVFVGDFDIVPITIDDSEMAYLDADYYYTEFQDIRQMCRPRKKYSHKGTFGHTLLITGAKGKAGAAVVCCKACHRAGSGLVTACVPSDLVDILQISTPETMVTPSSDAEIIADIPDLDKYSAIGIGPGIGTDAQTVAAVKKLLQTATQPLVLDADALNILAANPELMELLPKNSILTPHPKEFERLFGKTDNSIERLERLAQKAEQYNIIIVLKGAHTAVADSHGYIYFNSTGNPGMATAGSGDVLTGVIAALLSQKYSPIEAARIGVYVHGMAGDLVAERIGVQGVVASDIIEALPLSFKKIADN
ncbi:MAG: NAD(P)H-hydrate dehydratase [Bacteroidales bacterium]|nr:NAD(P)H-hydrate dehydratase [Bacteroidales bacterium]